MPKRVRRPVYSIDAHHQFQETVDQGGADVIRTPNSFASDHDITFSFIHSGVFRINALRFAVSPLLRLAGCSVHVVFDHVLAFCLSNRKLRHDTSEKVAVLHFAIPPSVGLVSADTIL